jgi:cold shock protein
VRVNDPLSRKPYEQEWLRDVLDDLATSQEARRHAFRHSRDICHGTVKFFNADKGWGGIESTETPTDVWVHFSDIEGSGFRALDAGEKVEFRWEPTIQDSWRCRATWVRRAKPRPP